MDEILGQIFGEAVLQKLTRSRRAQLLFRVFFGILGGVLGAVGAVHFALKTEFTSNLAMRGAMIMTFVGLASFFLFNVGLGRKWRWPGLLFAGSFVALFPARILFGA